MTTCNKLRPQGTDARSGQTTVEFSLILLPFFILVFATLDIAMYYLYDGTLENAMRETAHFTAGGGVIPCSPALPQQFVTNNGVYVHVPIPDPEGGSGSYPDDPTSWASRNESSKLWFRSNSFLPGVEWLTGVHLTSQTNLVPNMPSLSADQRTLSPSNLGPGNMGDYCQIVGTVPVASITGFMTYLSQYQEQGGNYVMRASTTSVNEPDPSTFKEYVSTNTEETQ